MVIPWPHDQEVGEMEKQVPRINRTVFLNRMVPKESKRGPAVIFAVVVWATMLGLLGLVVEMTRC